MTAVVVGYVRSAPDDRPGAADGTILAYATRHELGMNRIHRDDRSEPDRAGFLAVLDDVRTNRANGVLIASADHLSPVPRVREALARLIEQAGGRLYLADSDPAALRRQVAIGHQTTVAAVPTDPRPGQVVDYRVLPAQAVPNLTRTGENGKTP